MAHDSMRDLPMNILLVEDDLMLNQHIAGLLQEAGHTLYATVNAADATSVVNNRQVDAAIVDLGLPDQDGISLLQGWRQQQHPFPILILTARGNWQDKVIGLDAGADDYMVKPFQKEELMARLAAMMRRSGALSHAQLKAGPYRLDPARKEFFIAEEATVLTQFEYNILEYLMRNAGEVISKQQLMEKLYDDGDGDANTLEVLISRLRKKLDPEGTIQPITTIRRQGYLFTLPCQ